MSLGLPILRTEAARAAEIRAPEVLPPGEAGAVWAGTGWSPESLKCRPGQVGASGESSVTLLLQFRPQGAFRQGRYGDWRGSASVVKGGSGMLVTRLECVPRTEVSVLPQMIAAGALLELSLPDLAEDVAREIHDNPALEGEVKWEQLWPRVHRGWWPRAREATPGAAEFDWLAAHAQPISLQDHLRQQLYTIDDAIQRKAAALIIAHINDDGYLTEPIGEIAELAGVRREVAVRALSEVRHFDPVGCGARSLHEALLTQLRDLAAEVEVPPLAEAVLAVCCGRPPTRDLVGMVSRELKVPRREIEVTLTFVRSRLTPYPGRAYRRQWPPEQASPRLLPDATVRDEAGRLVVEIPESRAIELRVAEAYRRLDEGFVRVSRYSRDPEVRHVRHQVALARAFIDGLRQRVATMERVTEAIVRRQAAFIRGGAGFLQPLTRKEIAEQTGLHESTVCRATKGKFVQLPCSELVPFSTFFDDALPTKTLLKQLIANEDPRAPLSDPQLVGLLQERGIQIARRTVTKYREKLRVPSAAERKAAMQLTVTASVA